MSLKSNIFDLCIRSFHSLLQKYLDKKMSTFRITFKCYWHDGKFVDLEDDGKMEE